MALAIAIVGRGGGIGGGEVADLLGGVGGGAGGVFVNGVAFVPGELVTVPATLSEYVEAGWRRSA
jgi:hypothetical protein